MSADIEWEDPGMHSDGTAVVAEAASKSRLMILQEEGLTFSTAAFSPNGELVVAESDTVEVVLWKVMSDVSPIRLPKYSDSVTAFAFIEDGHFLVSAGLDDNVTVWDFAREKIANEFAGLAEGVVSVAINRDGSRIAWSSYGGILRAWDPGAAEPETLFQFDEGKRHHTSRRFTQIAFRPEGRYLATANQNGTVFIFRIAQCPAATDSAN